jgi:hypothetical protein
MSLENAGNSFVPVNQTQMNVPKRNALFIGILFIIPFFAYSTADGFISVALNGTAINNNSLIIGAALVLVNALCVALIGMLTHKTLSHLNPAVTKAYRLTRLLEASGFIIIAATVLYFTYSTQHNVNSTKNTLFWAYQSAMLVLSLGSLPFFKFLQQQRFIPRYMAVWGIGGYILLAAGSLLEMAGLPVSLYLSIPGGLFELVFAIRLMVKGFTAAPR